MESLLTQSSALLDLVKLYGLKVLGAIVVLLIGLWVVAALTTMLRKLLEKREIDASLRPFLVSLANVVMKVLLGITVIGMLGIQMTSFVAIIGAAGFAVGMALSGTLQNFAGGVMILIFRPFKVGDFIEAQGHSGSVKEIQIFNTILTTGDNKTIVIPNSPLSTGTMVNYSTQATRRVEVVFGIGYTDSIDKAREIILKILEADERAHKDPEPSIVVSELAESSVNLRVRVWVNSSDYAGVLHDTLEAVKKEFDKQGISIPFPQREVHLRQA